MMSSRSRTATVFITVFAVLVAILFRGSWVEASGPETTASFERQGEIIARVAQSGRPWTNLQDGYESHVIYRGKGSAALSDGDLASVRPTALFSADINGDGFPDLAHPFVRP